MFKQKTILLLSILLCAGFLSLNNIAQVKATWVSVDGDADRELDTDLQFAFPNGTFLLYNYTSTYYISAESNELNFTDGTSTSNFYNLYNVFYESIDENQTDLIIDSYENNTQPSTCPIYISEWDFDDTDTEHVTRSLSNISTPLLYYPEDVFLDDLFLEDDSYIESLFIFGGFIDSIEIQEMANETNVDLIDNFNGMYQTNFSISGLYDDDDENNVTLDSTIDYTGSLRMDVSLNCYHIADSITVLFNTTRHIVNISDTNSWYTLSVGMLMQVDLICSTLLDCDAGYELFGNETGQEIFNFFADNWYWFLILLASVAVTLLIAFLIQRSGCDKVSNPADHLACRIGSKYVSK